MSMNVSEQWLRDYCERTGQKMPDLKQNPSHDKEPLAEQKPRRSKYGNKKTTSDGMIFDSKHEAECYEALKLQTRIGDYRALFCQVAFTLPGDVKYIADFVTLNNDGTYTVYDAKSEATRKDKTYRLKKRLMRNCLNIEIQEV